MRTTERSLGIVIGVLITLVWLWGCSTTRPPAVVAVTGTVIGLEISQNPASQAPQMKLGYDRAELAVIQKEAYGGDIANVLMELRYGGAADPHPGIYQRLAVGRKAVGQAGASVMFMKDAGGNLSPEAARAAQRALDSIPTVE